MGPSVGSQCSMLLIQHPTSDCPAKAREEKGEEGGIRISLILWIFFYFGSCILDTRRKEEGGRD